MDSPSMKERPAPAAGLWFLDRILGVLTGGMTALGTLLIFAVMILVNSDIALRFALNAPVRGVAEIVSVSIVGIVFLQLPHTLRMGRITRAELLLQAVLQRSPRAAAAIEGLFDLCGAVLFAILAIASWRPFIEAYTMGHYLGSPGDFTVPVWPVRLLIVLGAWVLVVQYAALFLRRMKAAYSAEAAKAGRHDEPA